MSAVLELDELRVTLGRFRLGPINLSIAQGEYLVIVGPSGAGKSVLLEAILGWHIPAGGSIRLDGREVHRMPARERGFAYVPQDIGLLEHLSVRENLLFPLRCRDADVDPSLLSTLTTVLNLGPLLDRRDPRTLSQGERQRVALGRALLIRPRKLFLDEPSAALDPHLRREFQLLLRRLHRELGQTVVHVTHDREEAFLLGERIAVMLAGRLRQIDAPAALYQRPANLPVARFLAPENLWPARVELVEEQTLRVRLEAGRELRLPRSAAPGGSGELLVGIRPEEVMLLHEDRPLRPHVQQNVFEGEICEMLRLDGRFQIRLRTEDGWCAVSRLPICAAEDMRLREGQSMRFSLKSRSLYTLSAGG